MKKIFVLLSVVMFLSFTLSAFARGNAKRNVYTSNQMNTGIGINQNISRPAKGNLMPTLVQTLPYEDLSDAETNSLIFMVEEEKLAKDVYLALGERWGLNIFTNIANSEQNHMNAIISLLEKYGLDISYIGEEGVFNNQELQTLYTELVEQGNISIIDALTVGATIEDLDIRDLEAYLQNVDNQDITLVYQNLTKGSRNHLRAYVRNLNYYGSSYGPQFISQEEFNYIISSPMERGMLR